VEEEGAGEDSRGIGVLTLALQRHRVGGISSKEMPSPTVCPGVIRYGGAISRAAIQSAMVI